MIVGFAWAMVMTASAVPCPGDTTVAVNACLSARLAEEDARMARYYQAALGRADDAATRAGLERSQRDWAAYRTTECIAAADRYRGGTIMPTIVLGCDIRLA